MIFNHWGNYTSCADRIDVRKDCSSKRHLYWVSTTGVSKEMVQDKLSDFGYEERGIPIALPDSFAYKNLNWAEAFSIWKKSIGEQPEQEMVLLPFCIDILIKQKI